jgi:hypothetical protein
LSAKLLAGTIMKGAVRLDQPGSGSVKSAGIAYRTSPKPTIIRIEKIMPATAAPRGGARACGPGAFAVVVIWTHRRRSSAWARTHESPRTTKLYDRTREELSLDEVHRKESNVSVRLCLIFTICIIMRPAGGGVDRLGQAAKSRLGLGQPLHDDDDKDVPE